MLDTRKCKHVRMNIATNLDNQANERRQCSQSSFAVLNLVERNVNHMVVLFWKVDGKQEGKSFNHKLEEEAHAADIGKQAIYSSTTKPNHHQEYYILSLSASWHHKKYIT